MRRKLTAAVFMLCAFGAGAASAGVYTEDLSRCLVDSSTASDKATLVRWMFTAMALHPEVAGMSSVTPEQREDANKAVADVFMKLMTQTCLSETRKAVQYEGSSAVEKGFNALGQVAGREMFANPNVAQGMVHLQSYMDKERLRKALGN